MTRRHAQRFSLVSSLREKPLSYFGNPDLRRSWARRIRTGTEAIKKINEHIFLSCRVTRRDFGLFSFALNCRQVFSFSIDQGNLGAASWPAPRSRLVRQVKAERYNTSIVQGYGSGVCASSASCRREIKGPRGIYEPEAEGWGRSRHIRAVRIN